MSKDTSGLEAIGALLLLLFIPVIYVLNGWVIQNYWNWFVLPVFETLPILTLGQSVGLSLVVSMFKADISNVTKKDSEALERLTTMLLAPPLMVLFGWIVYSFIY